MWFSRRNARIEAALGLIASKLDTLINSQKKQEKSMSLLDDKIADLTAEVAKNTTITTSVVTLLRGVPALIDAAVTKALAAGATEAQLKDITDLSTGLKANDQALADAIAANTPTQP